MDLNYMKYLMLLFGTILAVQTANLGETVARPAVQEKTIEEKNEKEPVKTSIKVKELNDEQKQLLSQSPKMLEKTKTMRKVRKAKDGVEERTKVVYRTRLIGLFSPKVLSNFQTIDKLLDALNDSSEDDDDSSSNEDAQSNKSDNSVSEIFNELEAAAKNEVPANNHSSKKELQSETTVKGEENTVPENKLKESPLRRVNTVENLSVTPPPIQSATLPQEIQQTVKSILKQPTIVVKTDNMEDENETGFRQPVNPFRKVNFVDSLELYRNEQQRKAQTADAFRTFVNNNNVVQPNTQPSLKQPVLQRQFSIYRHPSGNENETPTTNVDLKNQQTVPLSRPVIKDPISSLFLPMINQINAANALRNQEHGSYTNPNVVPPNRPQPQPVSVNTNTLGSDWLSALLMRKVAQAEAMRLAQMRAMQTHLNEAPQQREEILHREQDIPQHNQRISA